MQTFLTKRQKDKWVKALNSGHYAQTTTGTLYDKKEEEYCCLGVLCKINRKSPDGDFIYDYIDRKLDGKPTASCGAKVWKFINLNDTQKWSFKKIATWIEKNVKTK